MTEPKAGRRGPGISISIVTYNTWQRTSECIFSILEELGDDDYEVLVLDNGQPYEGMTLPDKVKISRPGENVGFGAGHNLNLDRAIFPYFLILNPDTTINYSAIYEMQRHLQRDPEASAVAPKLINEDGSTQRSYRRLPSLMTELGRVFGLDRRVNSIWSTLVAAADADTQVVPQPAGAALMVRKRDLASIGGFDEDFPMYFEDVDLCKRLGDLGVIHALNRVAIVHDGEGTAKQYRTRAIFWIEHSRRRYYRKHFPAVFQPIFALIVLASCTTHACACLMSSLLDRGKTATDLSKARGYLLAIKSMVSGNDAYWRRRMLTPS